MDVLREAGLQKALEVDGGDLWGKTDGVLVARAFRFAISFREKEHGREETLVRREAIRRYLEQRLPCLLIRINGKSSSKQDDETYPEDYNPEVELLVVNEVRVVLDRRRY